MAGLSIFDISAGAMRSQMVRLSTSASNLANAGTVAGDEKSAYRPIKPVFRTVMDQEGNATVEVSSTERSKSPATRRYEPDHPLANEEGFVFEAAVDSAAEMVEMLETSRQYQNSVTVLQTAKDLINETIRS